MNSNPSPHSMADEQAALWAARLEGARLSAADREALDVWLEASPGHRALLSNYCQFSADLEVQLPALVRAGAIAMPLPAKRPRSRGSFPKLVGMAAGIAAAVALGFWVAKPAANPENFVSIAGQRQTFTLTDGTQVVLNARTNLQFIDRGGERRARLVEGEAFFIVSKNKARPFTVETPTGSVRVTGTTFDVRTDATTLEVAVVEGAVQVLPRVGAGASEPVAVSLGAGDQLLATASGGVAKRKLSDDALERTLAWRQGMVRFVDEPLDAALAQFARYHGRSIQVSPAAGKLLVSSTYSLDDLEDFIRAIEDSLGVRRTKEPNGVWRVSLRSE